MKIFAFAFLILLLFVVELHASDPDTICETTTAFLALSSVEHCKKGDLIEVNNFDMEMYCDLDQIVVPISNNNKFLCVYRGSKRDTRKRPLSEAEKQLDKESIEKLVDKYSN